MVGLPEDEKFEDMFSSFNTMHKRDRQTDRWMDRHRTMARRLFYHQRKLALLILLPHPPQTSPGKISRFEIKIDLCSNINRGPTGYAQSVRRMLL